MKPIVFLLAATITLSACDKDAEPRPLMTQEDMTLQQFVFKISPDDWEAYGTPGDDTHGYSAKAIVQIIDQSIVANGVVNLYLQRSSGNWLELPVTITQGGPDGNNWNFTYSTNNVRVQIDRNGEAVTPPDSPLTFKVTAGMK